MNADLTLGDVLHLLRGVAERGGDIAERGQPEAVDVGEEVAGSSSALTLHEQVSSELGQAASWRRQGVTATLITSTCILSVAHTGSDIIKSFLRI